MKFYVKTNSYEVFKIENYLFLATLLLILLILIIIYFVIDLAIGKKHYYNCIYYEIFFNKQPEK